MKVYLARAMSNRVKEDVVREAKHDKEYLESIGIEVLDPVTTEGVEETKDVLLASKKQMDIFWLRDKQMIREAHVLFNMSPNKASLGVIREHGYARYHLWKKVISVFPFGELPAKGAISYYEDDFVTDHLECAMLEALRTHGTLWKRLKWRMNIYRKCWLKAVWYRLKEWK